MSEGDLVSLCLFVVAPDEAQQALWREGAAMASMPIEFESGDSVAAKVALSRGGIDICLLDDALSESERASVLKAVRRVKPAPLICLSTARSGVRGEIANVLRRPKNAKEAGALVEICIELKTPIPVLIVDEHESTRRVVRKILSSCRFELDIREAADNTEALNHLRRELITGMVFLDYDMPGLNGADFLKSIRRTNPKAAVVVMTNAKSADDRKRRPAGAFGLLKKPFYPADVDGLIERYRGLRK